MPGESKLSVAGLPPGLTVGALLAAAALAVAAQLVGHEQHQQLRGPSWSCTNRKQAF